MGKPVFLEREKEPEVCTLEPSPSPSWCHNNGTGMSQGQMIGPGRTQFKECYRSSKLLSQKLYSLLFKMLSTS